MEQTFENIIRQDLYQYLLSVDEVSEPLPNCPDVEEKWEEIANAYITDGIREFANYPTVSLGWMMYIGMAIAKMWDTVWEVAKQQDLYTCMRSKRGYDNLDDYIRQDVLLLNATEQSQLEQIVGECASRTYNTLRHQNIEPGTREAFDAYVQCLHQLYLMGVAMQLKRMGYKMTKIQ